MKNFILFIAFSFGFFISAQSHTVAAKENPYSIAKKYGLTVDELYRLNPQVKDGVLRIGEVLSVQKNNTTVNPETGFIILKPKQTVYGITKQYHISEAALRKLNPELDSHLKIGDRIYLPATNIAQYGDKASPEPQPASVPDSEPSATPAASNSDTYVIQPRDNYYRITKNFSLSQADLFALNPGLEEKGLRPGEIIVVKGSKTTTTAKPAAVVKVDQDNTPVSSAPRYTDTAEQDGYVTYTVKNGDTIFGILNRFSISFDELLALNPQLSAGLKSGMVLRIRKTEENYMKKSGDVLNVVLMLPFGFEEGEMQYRTLSSDFLAGAKMAIERNAARGLKMNVNIVDSGSESSFKNTLLKLNQENTDLIIGPFFKSNIVEVLDYVKSKKIPVVSPFANAPELHKYSNLIIIEPDQEVYIEKIVQEVKSAYSNQKIYLVDDTGKNAAALRAGLEKTLKNPQIMVVNSAYDIQLDQNMMTGSSAPVIAVLATDNDGVGNGFAGRVADLAKEVSGMKAFSMFYHPAFEKKTDELSQASLVYLMDRKINEDGSFEKEILAQYRDKYCKTPSKYAIIGFDVVNDMLSRENKNGDLFRQIKKVQTQLATKFEFERAKSNGAYINTGYRVIRLVP